MKRTYKHDCLCFLGQEDNPCHVMQRATAWIGAMKAKARIWDDFVLLGLNYSYDSEWHVHTVLVSFSTSFVRRDWPRAEGLETI